MAYREHFVGTPDTVVDAEVETPDWMAPRDRLHEAMRPRIDASIRRRAPFLNAATVSDIAEDVHENVAALLKEIFEL